MEIHRIRVDGQKPWFSNTMTSCLGSRLALRHAHTIRNKQIFHKYGGRSLRFRKYPATCGRSNTIRKRYVWTQIFLNTENSKIPSYVWTGPYLASRERAAANGRNDFKTRF